MGKVMLDEMTWREAAERLKKCDAAFIPTGTIEGHGPIPLGCDSYVATAVAKLMAEKAGGVALPPLMYNFTGATTSFVGSVTVTFESQVSILKDIVRSLWRQGFRRIFIISIHGPNDIPIGTVVRGLFEWERIPVVYLNPWGTASRILVEMGLDKDEAWMEATLAFGAMKIIGKENAIPDVKSLRDRHAEAEGKGLPTELQDVQRYGMVGYHFDNELQHQPPRSGVDPDFGVELLNKVANALLPVVDNLGRYQKTVEKPFKFLEPE
ncbi:MAG: creatininase family protein [Candidatus Brockarchaeota archaeon]|nr:creatininase family protein [Candidatus Brockarchaeota archaeon]